MEKVSNLLNDSFNIERNLKQQGNIKYDFNKIINKQDLISNLDDEHDSTSVVFDKFGTMTTIIIPPKLQEEMAANPEKKKYVHNVIKDFCTTACFKCFYYGSREYSNSIYDNF